MTFEHPSMAIALRAAGLLPEPLVAELAGSPLFIAWSSRDVLAIKPQYAWLLLEETVFIQLPETLANIKSALDEATCVIESADYAQLQTPVGQLEASLGRLSDDLESDRECAAARLSEICEFCAKRWPGLFEAPLDRLRVLFRSDDKAICARLTEWLTRRCDRAIVYDCFKQFFNGAGKDIVNQGPGPSRAAIGYFLSGHIDMTDVIEILSEDQWWRGLADALSDVSSQIDSTGAAEEDVGLVSPRLENLRESVTRVSGTLEALVDGQDVSQESLRLVESELGEIIETIAKISEEQDSLKRTIEEECAHA